jgi:valacyclovir hydrolase
MTGLILSALDRENVNKLVIWGSNAYVTAEDRQQVIAVKDTKKWSPRAKEVFVKLYGEELLDRLWTSLVDHYCRYDDICKNDLKNIVCPTLILYGDLDQLVAKEHPQYLVNNIKNAKLYRFPKGKHNMHQKYSEEFNKIVEQFLLQ